MSIPAAVQHISAHILEKLSQTSHKPLFVALQGPQGSGKSFLTGLVHSTLTQSPHNLRVAVLSIDDLYLPHHLLLSLADTHLHNPLWRGRGQPGTHDIELGIRLLQNLKNGEVDVEIPRFEKSLFNGEGDRLPMDGSGVIVKPPVDIVVMEGWCTGFYPISQAELDRRWNGVWLETKQALQLPDEIVGTKDSIQEVNAKLSQYVDLWGFFDVFVKLQPASSPQSPSQYSLIYKWRLQQEHHMKAYNGGQGMTDEAVKLFVDRYIPGYVFFGDGVIQGYVGGGDSPVGRVSKPPKWLGNGLAVVINEDRQVVNVEHF